MSFFYKLLFGSGGNNSQDKGDEVQVSAGSIYKIFTPDQLEDLLSCLLSEVKLF